MSGDKPEKNQKFKAKYNLNYTLLSDTDYGLHDKLAIKKSSTGGTLRSTIIIGKDGKIVGFKKAGPEETVKYARTQCGLTPDDGKLKEVEKAVEKAEAESSSASAEKTDLPTAGPSTVTATASDNTSKQATVEEAPDAET